MTPDAQRNASCPSRRPSTCSNHRLHTAKHLQLAANHPTSSPVNAVYCNPATFFSDDLNCIFTPELKAETEDTTLAPARATDLLRIPERHSLERRNHVSATAVPAAAYARRPWRYV